MTPVNLNREAVDRVYRQLRSGTRGGSGGLRGALNATLTGDKDRLEAARRVLGQAAQSLAADGRSTVVVVIGNELDRDKVVESLNGVRRVVHVAYVDRSFSDEANDNTVLQAGLAGVATDAVTNLWVFLPRAGTAPRASPNHTLSTKVATPALWEGIFGADGDAVDPTRLRESREESSGSSESGAPGTSFNEGDVVRPRIATVRVHAEPSADSKVVGSVARSDELVVTGAVRGGFVRVEGTSVTGWVSINLVTREPR